MAGILSEFFPKNISTTEYVRELRDLWKALCVK
jgi:hypothetical protein